MNETALQWFTAISLFVVVVGSGFIPLLLLYKIEKDIKKEEKRKSQAE
ncbi:MAG TPA: hypothetical protein VIK74_08040 [Parasegetibacter sp.]